MKNKTEGEEKRELGWKKEDLGGKHRSKLAGANNGSQGGFRLIHIPLSLSIAHIFLSHHLSYLSFLSRLPISLWV